MTSTKPQIHLRPRNIRQRTIDTLAVHLAAAGEDVVSLPLTSSDSVQAGASMTPLHPDTAEAQTA